MSPNPTNSEPHPSSTQPPNDHTTQPISRWPITRNTVMPAQLAGLASAEPPAKPDENQRNQNHADTVAQPRRGPPILFDDPKRWLFCDLVRNGFTKSKAARLVGVAPRTVQEAAQNDPLFAAHVRQALFEFHSQSATHIARAGENNWRAAAWLLDRARTKRKPARPPSRSLRSADPVLRRELEQIVCDVLLKVLPDVRSAQSNARQFPGNAAAAAPQASPAQTLAQPHANGDARITARNP